MRETAMTNIILVVPCWNHPLSTPHAPLPLLPSPSLTARCNDRGALFRALELLPAQHQAQLIGALWHLTAR